MRPIALPLAASLLISTTARSAEPTTAPADFVSRVTRSGLTLSLPPRWRDAALAAQEDIQLALVDETGRQSLAVSVGPVTPDLTVEASVRTLPAALQKSVPGFRLVSADVVKLGDEPACRVVYERTERGLIGRQCEWLMVENGFEYLFLFTALANEFDRSIATVERVAQSIQIPKTAPLTVADYLTCAAPDGFVVEPSTPKRVRYFAHRSADGRLTKTIQIDGGLAKMPNADAIATSLAGVDGHVSAIEVDGSSGVRFESTSTAIDRPRAGVVIFRNHRVFMLVATSTGEDVSADLEAALRSWHWTRPAE